MNVEYVPIEDIKIGNRERLDYGDIEAFAENLNTYGLMNPIILNKNRELVDGGRRIKAFQLLGYETIPCIVQGERLISSKLDEIQANSQRKDWTDYERLNMVETLREEYNQVCDSHTRFNVWAGKVLNCGESKIHRLSFIKKHASAEDLEKLRKGETSVNKLYQAVKKREDGEPAKKKKPKKKPEPKPTGPCVSYCPLKAEDFIYEIAYTFRLDPGDPRWNNVIAYIERHSEKPM